MLKRKFKYLILIVFLSSIILIVFLQYNSGKSIKHLITDNESLLNELQIKSKLQKLQTDIIFSESALRDLVSHENRQHVEDLTDDYSIIQKELAEIDSTIRPTSQAGLLDKLKFLMKEKIENSDHTISILYSKGPDFALALIRNLRGRIIRDSAIQVINLINDSRQVSLRNISTSVSTNGVKAKSWGIILAIIACLASIIAFWYLIDQGQRQQKLIKVLDASEKKLKEASRTQEQFVTNMSHEIRTPMNAILGFAGLLQKTTLDKNQQDYVRSIRSSAENLLTIINDILDFSRIESGMMHIEKIPFNLREMLHSLVTMMDVKARSMNLYLRSSIDDSIPHILKGDAIRLTQILLNLITNALKFTHEGGVTIQVEGINKTENVILIRFAIADTGIGIEEEKQKNIFERFRQAHPETTRRYGGTGLGLAIVKQLVEIQNGTISIASEPGKGSIFTVALPYEVLNENEVTSTIPSTILATKPLSPGIKVLVAEDNQMNQKLIQYLLEQWQINFDIAANGRQAIEILKEKPREYGMVLMDIQMPEKDGYAATDEIRNDLKLSIPIVAMTAHALAGEKEKCLAAGMDDYLSKPINEEQLYKLINRYAGSPSGNTNSATSLIDLKYLQILSKGDKIFEENMIRSISVQIPRELNELKAAIGQGDYKKIASVAHSLKSTVSYMGLHQVTPILQQIETEPEKQNDLEDLSDKFEFINATCRLALKEAEELIS